MRSFNTSPIFTLAAGTLMALLVPSTVWSRSAFSTIFVDPGSGAISTFAYTEVSVYDGWNWESGVANLTASVQTAATRPLGLA
jgi:ABC-type sugar transport system permease subunit